MALQHVQPLFQLDHTPRKERYLQAEYASGAGQQRPAQGAIASETR